jgi:hypothetical protein
MASLNIYAMFNHHYEINYEMIEYGTCIAFVSSEKGPISRFPKISESPSPTSQVMEFGKWNTSISLEGGMDTFVQEFPDTVVGLCKQIINRCLQDPKP